MEKDYSQALYWYGKAAGQGLPDAMNSLGVIYEDGLGVDTDYHQAAKCYRVAAEHGSREGQFDLATMYMTGKGVPLDYVSAYRWFSLAASSGDKLSARQLKSLSSIMTPRQREEAESRLSSQMR